MSPSAKEDVSLADSVEVYPGFVNIVMYIEIPCKLLTALNATVRFPRIGEPWERFRERRAVLSKICSIRQRVRKLQRSLLVSYQFSALSRSVTEIPLMQEVFRQRRNVVSLELVAHRFSGEVA